MRKWIPLLTVSLGAFMLLIDVTIVNVALPDMALALKSSFGSLQWVIDIYAIALAALLLGAGALADRAGHRNVYVGGLALFALSSLCAGISPSTTTLIVARGFQGIGAAAMFATTISLINESYEGRDRGIAFGVWGAANGAAAAAGPVIGGLLTEGLSWRWIFFVNLPISIVAIVMSLRALPSRKGRAGVRIDLLGVVAFTVAGASLTYALTRAPEVGWGAPSTLGLFAVALLALIAFVLQQRRAANPIIALSLLRKPAFSGVLVAALLLPVAAFSYFPFLSLWLQSVRDMSPIGAGLAIGPMSVTSLVVALGIGRVLHSISPRLPIAGGFVFIGLGALLQAQLSAGSGWASLTVGLVVVGVGVGLVSPTLASAALAAVPLPRSGMAAGAVNTMRQLGYALGIAVLGAICQAQIAGALRGSNLSDADSVSARLIGGQAREVLAHAPGGRRDVLSAAIHSAFASGLNEALTVAGVLGIGSAALVALTVRSRKEPAIQATDEAGSAPFRAAS